MTARMGGLIYYRNKHLYPIVFGAPVNESKVKEGIEILEKALNDVENIFLAGDKAFLCGNEISIADLLAIFELKQPHSIGYDIAKDRPKLTEWMKRVEAILEPYFKEAFALLYSSTSLN
ncbi:GSTT1 (predicted) [Pycnogonum litorale]